jgi:hypothetical protein
VRSYQIQLRETQIATDGTDDVAMFDVVCEEDGQTWLVPVLLSPLFRWLQMESQAAVESRRDMVAGLGARAIAERLRQSQEPLSEGFLLFTTDYPGAPGAPDPLLPYERVNVRVGEEGDAARGGV